MVKDWFEWAAVKLPGDVSVEDSETVESRLVDADADSGVAQPIQTTSHITSTSRLQLGGLRAVGWFWATVAVVVLVAAVSGVNWALTRDSSTAAPPSTLAVTSSASSSPTSVPDRRCPDQPVANPSTPEGAFVAFQKAYFSGDARTLSTVIDPASYLADVDWVTIAQGMVGSEFCVKVISVKNGVVDATTTVLTPDGEEIAHLQLIYTVKIGNTYKISVIEDKQISAGASRGAA